MTNWFNVGKIVNTHGLNGEVRVISKTDFSEERYQKGNTLYLFLNNQEPVQLTIKNHRTHKNFDLLQFEGYENINIVEKWKNGLLKISEEQLTNLDEGEYYFHEIIGCKVITLDGEEIGIVKEILTPGANDVWVVKGKDKKEHLIPYIDDIIKNVNIEEKVITIDPMEGLLS
ncbi:ribosome maturation factor RimM [Heyndrickxia sporothermodurans]|uniref:ribosome maturation factor RimM n=1 Tax=Heyndrickxia sporothermodurans TaxID=46224 RepID=UPI002E1DE204|nr:ribosome maturation factor RimM [Heyndrickxia sporothermodurans]MED3650006.1 ribosome maturation factor RimM [Heyndrickxia sporothermodurans]MED3697992.1 ribosome maturation factor RimM [Heyndrickxia sporothermodurans]